MAKKPVDETVSEVEYTVTIKLLKQEADLLTEWFEIFPAVRGKSFLEGIQLLAQIGVEEKAWSLAAAKDYSW